MLVSVCVIFHPCFRAAGYSRLFGTRDAETFGGTWGPWLWCGSGPVRKGEEEGKGGGRGG